ncbi:MAG: ABC exporter membrane fusion protein [Microcoleaceae cyanobacterium]
MAQELKGQSTFRARNLWMFGLTGVGAVLVTALTFQRVSQTLQSSSKESSEEGSTPQLVAPTYITALGRLEPQGEVVELSAPSLTEGARIEEMLVKEGDRIQQKQVIAILDNRDRLKAELAQAEKEVAVRQAELAQVQAGAKQGSIAAQSATIDRFKAELEGQVAAQEAEIASLEAQLQGEREAQLATIERLKAQLKGERAAQEATIERLKAELKNAETECGRYSNLYQEGVVSTSEQDLKCLTAETAQKQLVEADANLARIIATQDAQINEAEVVLNRIIRTLSAQILEAQAILDRTILTLQKQQLEAEATREEIVEVRPTDVQTAQAKVEQAIAAQERAEADYNLAFIKSPINGQVLKVNTYPGERIAQDEGIIELGQTDQMYVVAEVYETDISRVRLGQVATITSDAFPGELSGKVDQVGMTIGKQDVLNTDPAADVDARVVEVKIQLNPNASQQVSELTNLQVTVKILPQK